MKSSSERGVRAGSSLKMTGWFGTRRSSAVTVPVSRAASTSHAGGRAGGCRSLLPPLMNSNATSLFNTAGRTTLIQCVHSGRSTSCSVSQRCDVISINVAVAPSAGSSRTTFHAKLGSGAATYRSSAVCGEAARAVCGCGAWCSGATSRSAATMRGVRT